MNGNCTLLKVYPGLINRALQQSPSWHREDPSKMCERTHFPPWKDILGIWKAQPQLSLLGHHNCNRNHGCQWSPVSDPVFGSSSDTPGPFGSLRFNSFFWPSQGFLWVPSPRTDHCCFAKATPVSIWSPNLKRASRPQQTSKLQWLPLLAVKKQLLKPTDGRIFKQNM